MFLISICHHVILFIIFISFGRFVKIKIQWFMQYVRSFKRNGLFYKTNQMPTLAKQNLFNHVQLLQLGKLFRYDDVFIIIFFRLPVCTGQFGMMIQLDINPDSSNIPVLSLQDEVTNRNIFSWILPHFMTVHRDMLRRNLLENIMELFLLPWPHLLSVWEFRLGISPWQAVNVNWDLCISDSL